MVVTVEYLGGWCSVSRGERLLYYINKTKTCPFFHKFGAFNLLRQLRCKFLIFVAYIIHKIFRHLCIVKMHPAFLT